MSHDCVYYMISRRHFALRTYVCAFIKRSDTLHMYVCVCVSFRIPCAVWVKERSDFSALFDTVRYALRVCYCSGFLTLGLIIKCATLSGFLTLGLLIKCATLSGFLTLGLLIKCATLSGFLTLGLLIKCATLSGFLTLGLIIKCATLSGFLTLGLIIKCATLSGFLTLGLLINSFWIPYIRGGNIIALYSHIRANIVDGVIIPQSRILISCKQLLDS